MLKNFRLGLVFGASCACPKNAWTIVECQFAAVKDCPKRKKCAPLRGGYAILDCLKQARNRGAERASSSASRVFSEAPLDAVELAKTIETRFCVTIKVTKNDPKPPLRTQIETRSLEMVLL
jgi:hypothetical protein